LEVTAEWEIFRGFMHGVYIQTVTNVKLFITATIVHSPQ